MLKSMMLKLEDINLKTEDAPKKVYIGKRLSLGTRKTLIKKTKK